MEYRHEYKFIVSALQLEKIKFRIEPLMKIDENQRGEYYTVRSLYFDDFYDNCLQEVEDGIDNRRKYRVRLYDGDCNVIHLERKSKHHGMTKKIIESLSVDDCQKYIDGENVLEKGAIKEELFYEANTSGMRAKCIVEYDRVAYVEEVGNVRVTFDKNIRGTMKTEEFLRPFIEDYTFVLPAGMHVLEVKYDELFPIYILQALDLNNLQKQSISKYAYVRYAVDKRRRFM